MAWGLVIAYRTDAWGGATSMGWADFFDLERYPGKRAIRRSGPGSGILEGALIADGVDPAALYPLDVERALTKLASIAGEIIWWEDGEECPELLANGTAQVGVCFNGGVYDAQQEGAPLAVQWTGALTQADYLIVPRGSPNVEAAMDLIAYMTSAENNARLAEFHLVRSGQSAGCRRCTGLHPTTSSIHARRRDCRPGRPLAREQFRRGRRSLRRVAVGAAWRPLIEAAGPATRLLSSTG
jgi:hypothetical protein